MRTHNPAQIMAWMVTVLATVTAVILLADKVPAQQQNQAALSQQTSVTAFPFQVRPGYEAIALIDHNEQTICIYQYTLNSPAHQRFSLLAARSFEYDTKLTDYNNAEPRPEDIRQWLQRSVQPVPNRGFSPMQEKPKQDVPKPVVPETDNKQPTNNNEGQ